MADDDAFTSVNISIIITVNSWSSLSPVNINLPMLPLALRRNSLIKAVNNSNRKSAEAKLPKCTVGRRRYHLNGIFGNSGENSNGTVHPA